MENSINDFILQSIGIESPYYVDEIIIDEDNKTINIKISSDKNKKFICPDCKQEKKVYDKLNKKWRHVDLVQYKVFIECKTPRVKCDDHGVKLVEVSWAKQRHQFTYSMEEFICELATKMPLVHVGRVVDEYDTRIKRIITGDNDEKDN